MKAVNRMFNSRLLTSRCLKQVAEPALLPGSNVDVMELE